MAPDRWYYLRHPQGFTPDLLECVRSGWVGWKTHVEAVVRHWNHVSRRGGAPPEYEWYEPELSADQNIVTIPIGGKSTYGSYHLLEEVFPQMLYGYLPQWLCIDLETGRRDTAGWFPETSWHSLIAPADRENYRRAFPRPQGA